MKTDTFISASNAKIGRNEYYIELNNGFHAPVASRRLQLGGEKDHFLGEVQPLVRVVNFTP